MAKSPKPDAENIQPDTDHTLLVPVEVGMEALHRETVPSMAAELEHTDDESTPAKEREGPGRE